MWFKLWYLPFDLITESLEMASEPKFVSHPQVGKYFEEYTGTHYVLNTETRERYPEDMEKTVAEAARKYNTWYMFLVLVHMCVLFDVF